MSTRSALTVRTSSFKSLTRARAASGNRATRIFSNPLAREARRAAKILAQAQSIAAAQRAIRVPQELDFDVDGLHGLLVEVVDVRFLGHRGRILLLRRGCHVVSSRYRGRSHCNEVAANCSLHLR